LEEELEKNAVCQRSYLTYSEYLTKDATESFGDFKIGQAIRTLIYADGLVLLAKEETVLQGVIDRLFGNGRWVEWK
jgi:hypothetical protein